MKRETLRMSYTHADGAVTDFDKREPALWGVYVRGQDEWFPATSREGAEQYAHAINTEVCKMIKNRLSPNLWAVPDFWPWSKEDHAAIDGDLNRITIEGVTWHRPHDRRCDHDTKADGSGLDDGPPLYTQRKRPDPKSSEEMKDIRSRAWATRRAMYGERGHR